MEAMYLYVSAVEALAPEWWRWPPLGLVEAEAGSPTDRVGTSTPQGLKIRHVSESNSKSSNSKKSDSPSTPQGFKIKRVEEGGSAVPSLLLPPASPPSTSSLPPPAAPPTASHATPARVALGGWTALSVEGAPARYRHGCAVVGARLFVWGGRTNSGRLADGLYRLDLLSGRWNEIEISSTQMDISTKGNSTNSTNQPPELRWGHSMNTYRQWIVIFGGHANRRCLNDVAMLDTEANTWFRPSPSGDLPPPRGSHASCVVSERLWAFGGDWASGGDAAPPLPQHAWSLPLRAAAAGDDCAWTLAQVLDLKNCSPTTHFSHMAGVVFLPDVTYLIQKKQQKSKKKAREIMFFRLFLNVAPPLLPYVSKMEFRQEEKTRPPFLLAQASGTPPAPGYDHTAAVCAQSVLLLGGSSASGYVSLATHPFSHMSGVVCPVCHRCDSKQAKKQHLSPSLPTRRTTTCVICPKLYSDTTKKQWISEPRTSDRPEIRTCDPLEFRTCDLSSFETCDLPTWFLCLLQVPMSQLTLFHTLALQWSTVKCWGGVPRPRAGHVLCAVPPTGEEATQVCVACAPPPTPPHPP